MIRTIPVALAVTVASLALALVLALPDVAFAQRLAPSAPATYAERDASWHRHLELDAASPYRGVPWRCVGPAQQGGRIVDVESVPGEPYTLYVVAASGGVWKTTNNGHTFTPLFDDQATIICGDLALDPRDPKRLWLGTGENNSSRSSYGGMGVYRSDDAGATWTWTGLGDSDRIGRIVVDPRDSSRVYVAALGKLYTPGGERGIYRTTDAGKTWKAVLPTQGFVGAIDLVMDPTDPRTLYAATWERSRRPWNLVESGPGSGVYKTSDGGDTWTRLEGGFPTGSHVGRIGLAISPARPRTIYASVDNQEPLPEAEWDLGTSAVSPKRLRKMTKEEFLQQDPEEIDRFARGLDVQDELDGKKLTEMVRKDEITLERLIEVLKEGNASLFESDIRGLEVVRSDDAGHTWRRTHEKPVLDVVYTYGYYFGQVSVDPKDADTIYLTGVPLIASHDGGKTFAGIAPPGVHVDHHELWIDPAFPDRIIAGNDGGLDVSYDRGKTWSRMDRIPLAQFYSIEVDDATPYNIYGGTQDNGTLKGSSLSKADEDSFEFIGGGDGMYVQIDPSDGTTYVGSQFGHYNRRGPGGGDVRPKRKLQEPSLRYNWCTPIHLSPHNADIVYFGANRLFRSMNRGATWTPISPDLTRSPERGDVPFGTITTVAESTLEFGLLWVGTDDGYVHVTQTGGVMWSDVSNGLPADRWVTRVEPSRADRNRGYVSLSGYRDDDIAAYLYVTEDLGATWKSIAAGLPAEAVNVVREDPNDPQILFVGTDRGVYVSHDRGATWESLPAGMPNAPVHDLKVHKRDRDLIIGTHGRSAFVLDAEPIEKLTAEIRAKELHVFDKADLPENRGWGNPPSLWHPDPDGPPTTDFAHWSKTAGKLKATILDSEGHALREVETDALAGINILKWDLLLDPALALPIEAQRVASEKEKERVAAEKQKETATTDKAATADKKDATTDKKDATADKDEDADEEREKGTLADTPWAEAIRLGRRLAVTPGKYELRLQRGDASASVKFEVTSEARGDRDRSRGESLEEEY